MSAGWWPCAQVLTRSDTGDMAVRYASETVPDVWASSDFAKEEFSDHLDIARKAVSPYCCAHPLLTCSKAVCSMQLLTRHPWA